MRRTVARVLFARVVLRPVLVLAAAHAVAGCNSSAVQRSEGGATAGAEQREMTRDEALSAPEAAPVAELAPVAETKADVAAATATTTAGGERRGPAGAKTPAPAEPTAPPLLAPPPPPAKPASVAGLDLSAAPSGAAVFDAHGAGKEESRADGRSRSQPMMRDKRVGTSGGVQGYGAGTIAQAPVDPRSGESYKDYGVNAWVATSKDALSTFAVDVDTASYTIARRKLTEGALPPKAAVRVEEFVNYFSYRYPAPDGARPFSVTADLAPSPFNAGRHLLRVGVASRPIAVAERKPANLVFLVDVSGSMQSADRLPLAKRSLRVLVDNLKDGDTVSLVTYAGSTRVVLAPTGLAHKNLILAAIEDLSAGGSTAMASGLELAYRQAALGLRGDTISRVIVLSDGDANVGNTSHDDMLKTIAGHVKEGVTLSTVGFGTGNYKDEMMEQLANKGNGNNYYIDGLSQARRVFQEQLGSTLQVVAKDVKIQVDLDPAQVSRYRLVGYENRDVADIDFRNDKVDAGEIGAGHQVTAVYEVELATKRPAGALATVRVRHKAPRGDKAVEAAFPVQPSAMAASFAAASSDLRFAVAVAAFADVLRGSEDAEHWSLAEIRRIAAAAAGDDADRRELVALVDRAIALSSPAATAAIAR